MVPISDELVELAARCAEKVDLPEKRLPSFSEVEEQIEAEYETLLAAMAEDEIFTEVDLGRQAEIVERLNQVLPQAERELLDELIDNQSRHLWLQQEGAYYVGLALGLRAARRPPGDA